MDGEVFFDDLYSTFFVPFPLYLVSRKGDGLDTRTDDQGLRSLVVWTDEDLVARHVEQFPNLSPQVILIGSARQLAKILESMALNVQYILFDPNPRFSFYRRFPLGAVVSRLPAVGGTNG
jgi:hypothetical protein